jgi:hypothetical protein
VQLSQRPAGDDRLRPFGDDLRAGTRLVVAAGDADARTIDTICRPWEPRKQTSLMSGLEATVRYAGGASRVN